MELASYSSCLTCIAHVDTLLWISDEDAEYLITMSEGNEETEKDLSEIEGRLNKRRMELLLWDFHIILYDHKCCKGMFPSTENSKTLQETNNSSGKGDIDNVVKLELGK